MRAPSPKPRREQLRALRSVLSRLAASRSSGLVSFQPPKFLPEELRRAQCAPTGRGFAATPGIGSVAMRFRCIRRLARRPPLGRADVKPRCAGEQAVRPGKCWMVRRRTWPTPRRRCPGPGPQQRRPCSSWPSSGPCLRPAGDHGVDEGRQGGHVAFEVGSDGRGAQPGRAEHEHGDCARIARSPPTSPPSRARPSHAGCRALPVGAVRRPRRGVDTHVDRIARTRLHTIAAEWACHSRVRSYLYIGSLLQAATGTGPGSAPIRLAIAAQPDRA
jgi:hypothetical protein